MEIGAWVGNNGPATPAHMLSVAQTADRTGLASVWAADHVLWPVDYQSKYPYGGDKYPADFNQPVAECVTTMTWLSANTRRVQVGSLVIVVPQRNPWLLARQLATIDVFNGGRTILGAGIGWLREEFEALKMPFDHRIARTEEAIALMRTIWTEHPVRFQGRFYGADPMGVLPHPVRRPIPIWLGGNTPGAIERAGRIAQGWVPYGLTPEALATGWDGVRRAAEAAGRDPSSVVCSLWAPITVTPRGAPAGPEGLPLYGPSELLVERLVEYSKAGLQHFLMFNFCDAAETAEQIEQIATEVLPHVKGLVGRGAP
ncbi:LLM class F420-dependent oxidoreductase [Myxococcota bacterium]|nr:LLM class F420-dependent oxidoreductase [Myxococcota bacterium]